MAASAYHDLARHPDAGLTVNRTYRLRASTAAALLALAERLEVSVSDLADYVIAEHLAAMAAGAAPEPTTAPATVRRITR